jgi:penicillin amidase
VDIHWNAHLVPFIEAKTDRDLAIALGVVHAHLRLAQMELLRRIAQGRLSEVLGSIAVPLDHGLRLLNPTRAVPLIELEHRRIG